jgi:fermentation-respiration switch protein FrsA (DUF1100 family)
VVVAPALLSLVAGCAHAPWSRPRDPLADLDVREASLLNGFVLLTVVVPRRPEGPKPAIVEGGAREARAIVETEDHLLARGVVIARFENNWPRLRPAADAAARARDRPAAPGGVVGSWLLAAPRPGIVGRNYFQIVAVSARTSVPVVLDHLATVPEVDPARIAVAGRSTTGFVALEALAREPRLAAAMIRVACGDYHGFLKESSLALAGDRRWLVDGRIVLDADYERELREREPIRTAARLPPRPLLMQNGRRDPAVPVSCALETAAVFERAYGHAGVPERFRFVLHDDSGHLLGSGAGEEEARWVERWLLGPGAVRPGESR